MKKENAVKNENEILSFEDLHKRMANLKKAVEDEMSKKQRLTEALESFRNEMIQIDTDISGLQEKLNGELIASGKVSNSITDKLQVLRAKRENLETNLIVLKTEAIPKIDETIKAVQKEMGLAYELLMDELKRVYAAMVQAQLTKIEMIAEEWLNESSKADANYGQAFMGIDRRRIRSLTGVKRDTVLLDRVSSF